jgi:DNA polymerase kappa
LEKLNEVAAELEKDMEQDGWTGRTVTLKYKLDTYQGACFFKCFRGFISYGDSLYSCEVVRSLRFNEGRAI